MPLHQLLLDRVSGLMSTRYRTSWIVLSKAGRARVAQLAEERPLVTGRGGWVAVYEPEPGCQGTHVAKELSTELPGSPVVIGFQLAPPLVLLKTLPSSGVVFEEAA